MAGDLMYTCGTAVCHRTAAAGARGVVHGRTAAISPRPPTRGHLILYHP